MAYSSLSYVNVTNVYRFRYHSLFCILLCWQWSGIKCLNMQLRFCWRASSSLHCSLKLSLTHINALSRIHLKKRSMKAVRTLHAKLKQPTISVYENIGGWRGQLHQECVFARERLLPLWMLWDVLSIQTRPDCFRNKAERDWGPSLYKN